MLYGASHAMTHPESGIIPADLARAALRVFYGLASAWHLDETEELRLLGGPTASSLRHWKDGDVEGVSWETVRRISALARIFGAINTLLPTPKQADDWIRRPNKHPIFAGASALDKMCEGTLEDLDVVRRYLQHQLA